MDVIEPVFQIRASETGAHPTPLISPDLPMCPDCLHELFDVTDRRYQYPYINCAHCGPCWSIIESLPYDRPRTTMKNYSLYPKCQSEYGDPMDRRFHAPPVAYPTCGPHIRLVDMMGVELALYQDAITQCAEALGARLIAAIKGLGGYYLAFDTRNAEAVTLLRNREARRDKPIALMARDLVVLDDIVQLSKAERDPY